MRTIETKDCVVTFPDDQATRDAVFERVVKFFLDNEVFCGESVMQCDVPLTEVLALLSGIADEVLRFEVEDK